MNRRKRSGQGSDRAKIFGNASTVALEEEQLAVDKLTGLVVLSFAIESQCTAQDRILPGLDYDPSGIIINTNNAETNVVVNNGQTAVIGGLTKQDEATSITGIPILKDIPLLGAVFRYETKTSENRDLVIFVTPTIVENDLAEAGQ